MKVALFVPCFIDAFFPDVAVATLELLERFGCEVAYPLDQTCCGQPMANSGCHTDAAGAEALFVRNFAGYDHIVGPSASCIHHVRENLIAIPQTDEVKHVSKPLTLLSAVKGIRFAMPKRPDECCGFGGTFSVYEEPVSARMGYDKVQDHHGAGAEYIVSADMSCLMHQKGCAERLELPIKFLHIAQVLNGVRE